jgi:hypothetical protein
MTLFWISVSFVGLFLSLLIFQQMFPKFITSIVRKDLRTWFSLYYNHLIKTIVKESHEKGHFISFIRLKEIIREEYGKSNPINKDMMEELEVLIDYMIDGIIRVTKRIYLSKKVTINEGWNIY